MDAVGIVASVRAWVRARSGTFDIKDYGAVSGMADATAAIQAALQAAKDYVTTNSGEWAEVIVPRGMWNIATAGGLVFDTPRVTLRGTGGTIRKKVNGPIFTINYTQPAGEANVGAGVRIIDVMVHANYTNGYTGSTVTLAGCNNFHWRGGEIIDGHVGSPLFKFTQANQTRRRIKGGLFRINGTPTNIGIFETSIDNGTDAGGAPDFEFVDNNCVGGVIDARGCENLFLRGNACRNILTDSISNKLLAIANRIASSGDDWTIYGSNHLIESNIINTAPGNLVLGTGAANCTIGENHVKGGTGLGRIIDRSGVTTNVIYTKRVERPSCKAYNGINQTMTGTTTALGFNSELFDTGSWVHDTAVNNTRLWFRWGGDWIVGVAISWASSSLGTYRFAALRVNGIKDIARQMHPPVNGARTRQNLSALYRAPDPSDITADTTSGSPNLTNVSVASYSPTPVVGQAIEGAGIPTNARIGSIAGTTYGLVDAAGAALNATATASAVACVSTDYVEVTVSHDTGGNLDVEGGTATTNAPNSPAWAKYID